MKASGSATDWREIDRFDDGDRAGVGWIAYPEETMQRASHALSIDGDVYVVDPVDASGVDDLVTEFGEVAGVVVLLDRHKRDAAAVARRHEVPVYLPAPLADIGRDIDATVEVCRGTLAETGVTIHSVVDNFAWTEVALYDDASGVLVVPEALGTTEYFLAGRERLGVHPALRLKPPKRLGRFDPERVVVGHGAGVHDDAAGAIADAISGARSRTPGLYLKNLKTFLPV